jgi:hypothetical protein
MHELLFRLWIWALGLLLAGTLTYGLANFPPDTITQHMIDHEAYRIALSVGMILQSIVWFTCLYAKRGQGCLAPVAFVLLTITLITWVCLTTILTTEAHLIFVDICMLSFILFVLALIFLIEPESRSAIRALELSLLILIAASAAMVALYTDPRFYIPEHIGSYAYALVFVSFFTVHTYPHWDPTPVKIRTADVEMYMHAFDEDERPLMRPDAHVWAQRF